MVEGEIGRSGFKEEPVYHAASSAFWVNGRTMAQITHRMVVSKKHKQKSKKHKQKIKILGLGNQRSSRKCYFMRLKKPKKRNFFNFV
jgi:hypothetical protein